MAEDEGKDRRFVTAVARGLDVLRAFREGETLLGNQDLCARTGLPKATVSRLTHTLTRLGCLDYVAAFGKYRLGAGVLSLGYAALAGMDIRQVARPFMQELADRTDASVSLGTRDRNGIVYVETCRGGGTLTLRLQVGSRIPLATSAMGRAWLAASPPAAREAAMAEVAGEYGDAWPQVQAGVAEAIRDHAERGFTLSLGGWQKDVNAVAVAVVPPDGGPVMALNCGGAAFLMPRRMLETETGPALVRAARAIEAALGGGRR